MPLPTFAEVTVSTGFLVVAWLAISAALLFILAALFGSGLRYKISETPSEDNSSNDFLRELESLTDSKIHHGTQLTVLTNGDQFYEEELRAIASARCSVNLEAYIFQEGEIAKRYMDAFLERARSGVKVNVVLDAVGSASTRDEFFSSLKQAGGKLAWYNNAKWYKLPRYNHRTHREILIIDGREAFIGGAGVADQWFRGKKTPRWRDTVVKVHGPAVSNLQATFAENWLESCGEVITGPEYFPELSAYGSDGGVALVVDSTPSAGGSTRARILFQMLIASAQSSIHITTPYFLPDGSMIAELVRASRERGVEVTLLVPGRHSDHFFTRSSSRHAYGKLLQAGARIYEYRPTMIHAKILLVDGQWGVVGSTNFDNRSFGLNDEVNLAVRNPDFVARLQQDFVSDLAQSDRVTYEQWRHRPVLERAPEMLGWMLEREQ